MNAPKMPRRKAVTSKKVERPEEKYVVRHGKSLQARLPTLQAALSEADEQIESAHGATKPGSPLNVLLDHVAHDMLVAIITPMLKEQPTRADAERTRQTLPVALAALQGAMSMADGTPSAPTLQEGFELLDWVRRECDSLLAAAALPQPDLTVDFARGRDHAIKMMREAKAIGDERGGWRCFRGGQAQDNLAEGYLRDVIEDPTLRHGFTAILSAAIQNEVDLSVLASITLAETQAGEIGADGTQVLDVTGEAAAGVPDVISIPRANVDEVVDILDSAAVVLDELLSNLNEAAAYGAQTLLIVAQKALGRAAAAQTREVHETANGAIGEAGAVLRCVAGQLHSSALRGVSMLVDLAKEKHDATLDCFDTVRR